MMAYEQDNHSSGNTKEAEIACYVQLIQSYPKAGMDLGRGLRGPGPKKKNQYVKFLKKKGSGPTWFLAQAPLTSTIPIPASQQLVQTPKPNGKAKKTKEKKEKRKEKKGRGETEKVRGETSLPTPTRERPILLPSIHAAINCPIPKPETATPTPPRKTHLVAAAGYLICPTQLRCSTAPAFTIHRYLIYHFLQNLIYCL